MKLDNQDYKLLSYLYHNNRESLTKIAKACRLSREQVDYKIKKYLSEGLIKKFLTVFSYNKLGYNCFVTLFINLKNNSLINNFFESLKENKNCISFGKMFGEYDAYINLIFKDEKEFSENLDRILDNYADNYLVIKPYHAEMFPLKFLKYKEEENILVTGDEKEKIDDKDKLILKALEENGRARLIDIAKKAGISSELALHKLRRLYKNKIILGHRIQFNMEKLGYSFSEITLNIKNKKQIERFARNHKHVNSLIFSMTRPNCIIQLFHKTHEE